MTCQKGGHSKGGKVNETYWYRKKNIVDNRGKRSGKIRSRLGVLEEKWSTSVLQQTHEDIENELPRLEGNMLNRLRWRYNDHSIISWVVSGRGITQQRSWALTTQEQLVSAEWNSRYFIRLQFRWSCWQMIHLRPCLIEDNKMKQGTSKLMQTSQRKTQRQFLPLWGFFTSQESDVKAFNQSIIEPNFSRSFVTRIVIAFYKRWCTKMFERRWSISSTKIERT